MNEREFIGHTVICKDGLTTIEYFVPSYLYKSRSAAIAMAKRYIDCTRNAVFSAKKKYIVLDSWN